METLVVVSQHRNQYHSHNGVQGPARFGSFGSPPPREFREINCRTFQSGAGIGRSPVKSRSTPMNKQVFSSSSLSSPKTPLSSASSRSEKSSAISVPFNFNVHSNQESSFSCDFSYSELWAGPAYSNSPPPSSLPIPTFSLRQKRTVSLNLPASASDIVLPPVAKSAPPSPSREHDLSFRDFFYSDGTDSATETLRRILNLDIISDK